MWATASDWRRRSSIPDREVKEIACMATEGIKEIIHLRSTCKTVKWPPWRTIKKRNASLEQSSAVEEKAFATTISGGVAAPAEQEDTVKSRNEEVEVIAIAQKASSELRYDAVSQAYTPGFIANT